MREAISPRIALIAILLLAGMMRLLFLGIVPTWVDELNILYPAIRLAHYGEMTWVGNESSFGLLTAHSPFSVYMTALPALIYPHPIFVRLFFALLGMLTVAIAYLTMHRYVGFTAAIITGALLSVMVLPIYWSRFVWNPNIAPVFLMLYLYSAIAGYIDGNKKMQWVHWLSLSCIIQSQSALLIIAPLTLGLAVIDIWRDDHTKQSLLRHAGMLLALLVTMVPWMIGLVGIEQGWWQTGLSAGNFDTGNITLAIPSAGEIITTVGTVVASAGYYVNAFALTENPALWWFPAPLHNLLYLQALLTIIGSIGLVGWHFYRQHEKRYLSLFLLVCAGWSLSLLIVDRRTSDFYMMLTPFASAMLTGWLLQILYQRSRLTLVLPLTLIGLQMWLSITYLHYFQRDTNTVPYGEIVSLADTWSASGTRDVLFLEDNPALTRLERREWQLHIRILSETQPIRYNADLRAIPISADGTHIITSQATSWVNDWASNPQAYPTDLRDFTGYDLDFASLPTATYRPQSDAQFGDLALITGLYADDAPTDSDTWHVFLYWQPLQPTDQTYQFSLRLKDDTDATLAQIDQTSLPPVLWREDDTVVSLFSLPITAPLPTDLNWEIVMYSFPDLTTVQTTASQPSVRLFPVADE